ncbi:MAG: GNAT family N-acetyltransferase [Verrucomicrobiota bacterium]|jgi:CelD/BcsL family acetyltransferase involved in cellulose biosynthesis
MMLATSPTATRDSDECRDAGPSAVDPLRQPDWDSLLAAHPQSSIFHGLGWARVLHDTYGHKPLYFARFHGKQLTGLLPVMEVSSPLTGRRGVSLPFTDACSPLTADGSDTQSFYQTALACGRCRRWKYLECRGSAQSWQGSSPSLAFYGHLIDLQLGPDLLYKGLDGAFRRAVRKAQEAGLRVEFSTGPESMATFYRLHCLTRRRHGLPPQPFRFFANIQRHVLAPGQGFVATARLEKKALAAAVFLYQGRQALYKFGASDYAAQQLRPSNLMMWLAIKQCGDMGLATLNLGRTSLSNEGLRRFKLALGATEHNVQYAKYDFSTQRFVTDTDRAEGGFNRLFACLPLPMLRLAGAVLYPHLS